jgi:glutamate--cysteine ligase
LDEQADQLENSPLTREDLIAFIRGGETLPQDWVVGTEHEKVGVYREGFAPVPYEGPRGIGAFLNRMAELDDWKPVYEGENVIALLKEGASITLEPGGQLELSGAPLRTIHQTCEEFHNHLRLVKEISHSFGIIWLGLGIRPLHGVDDVPRMPKARYGIMRAYLPTRAKLGVEMMHLTATVQANFDFSDEADMRRKMQMATGVSPILSALYANSSIAEKKSTGYASRRLRIWRDTDPDRCGLLPFVFRSDFGYGDYVDWALDVPMFFIVRDGRYIAMQGKTFRQLMLDGHEEHKANIGDFELHLTTLFPEVRLKRVIEVRGCDAVPSPLTCALPAFWKGLLYDREACAAAWEVVKDWEFDERVEFLEAAAKDGLSARTTRGGAKELSAELVGISSAGLRRIGHAGHGEPDETSFLEPLQAQIASGKSPGELLLEKWEGEWNHSLPRLMDYARYC